MAGWMMVIHKCFRWAPICKTSCSTLLLLSFMWIINSSSWRRSTAKSNAPRAQSLASPTTSWTCSFSLASVAWIASKQNVLYYYTGHHKCSVCCHQHNSLQLVRLHWLHALCVWCYPNLWVALLWALLQMNKWLVLYSCMGLVIILLCPPCARAYKM